jgi:hypothetical protein
VPRSDTKIPKASITAQSLRSSLFQPRWRNRGTAIRDPDLGSSGLARTLVTFSMDWRCGLCDLGKLCAERLASVLADMIGVLSRLRLGAAVLSRPLAAARRQVVFDRKVMLCGLRRVNHHAAFMLSTACIQPCGLAGARWQGDGCGRSQPAAIASASMS